MGEVQQTRLRLIGFYKDMSMLVNIPTPSLLREKPTVEKVEHFKGKFKDVLTAVEDYCTAST